MFKNWITNKFPSNVETATAFAKHCKKNDEEQPDKRNGEHWTLVQKNSHQKKGNGKGIANEAPSSANPIQEKDPIPNGKESSQIKPAKTALENLEHTGSPISNKEGREEIQLEASQGSPSNPSYAEFKRKKPVDSSGSSEDEIYERPLKRAGRKSHKEVREEEAKRLKTQGSQSTIEMSIGRNTRARPPKGGSHPPTSQ